MKRKSVNFWPYPPRASIHAVVYEEQRSPPVVGDALRCHYKNVVKTPTRLETKNEESAPHRQNSRPLPGRTSSAWVWSNIITRVLLIVLNKIILVVGDIDRKWWVRQRVKRGDNAP